jgi:hypothetical protein
MHHTFNTIWNPNPMFNGNMVLLILQKWIHDAENKIELVM